MKTIALLLITLCASQALAGEFEIADGEIALEIYNNLQGKKCIEYQTNYQIVYSRTNKLNCMEASGKNEWQCTLQYEKKKNSYALQSASCIREID